MTIKTTPCLPYMGSKRKLASRILDKMQADNPKLTTVYDLFGGGGAVSFEALSRGLNVVYNDANTGICDLLKDLQNNGVRDEYYQWVDRETFHARKNEPSWFGGLCQVVWSFGNGGKSYLYGETIEKHKKAGHDYVMHGKHFDGVPDCDLPLTDINGRRLFFCRFMKKSERFDLERLQRLQQLEHLERLERLERLQKFNGLTIHNLSFEQVVIDADHEASVIYLDPPYLKKRGYNFCVCYDALNEYIANSKHAIYLSSYEWDGLECVAEFEHRCTAGQKTNNKVIERLFCNKPQKCVCGRGIERTFSCSEFPNNCR